jgi:hypothetical protein
MKVFLVVACMVLAAVLAFGSALVGWNAVAEGDWWIASAMALCFAVNGYNLNTFWDIYVKRARRG